jgi:diguanylate cyclase (GGDEF)-like protein/PAS domain S-box-containing protein
MGSQLTMYITLVSLSGIFSLFLSFYVYQRRKEFPGARIFVLYTIALSIYSFGYAFELSSDALWKIRVWNLVEYIGMPFSVPLGLMIVLHYLGKKISGSAAAALFIFPAVTWFVVLTNDYHRLFYRTFQFKDELRPPYLEIEVGEWYIAFCIYTFCCWLAGVVLLCGRWKQTRKSFRPHLFTLICGQLIPMVTGLLYLFGVTPAGVDPVPMGTCVAAALYIWAILSAKMLTIIPIAKETIFESMGEGVIVLDSSDRLIDYNRTVAQMMPTLHPTMIGRSLYQVWTDLTGSAYPFLHHPDGRAVELAWVSGGKEQIYQVRYSALRHRSGEEAGGLLMLINVTELKRLQQELERQAYYDGLTNILNRSQFIRRCRELLSATRKREQSLTVVLFDLDYFKRVNDNFGHETGDKVLVHVVATCQRYLSSEMLFARYGGEEFVLALPSSTLEKGNAIAELLRSAMESAPLATPDGAIVVTASFGVAQAANTPDETLDTLLHKADDALYASKREGRNRVSVYDSAPPYIERALL